jgi:hypothetical protein
MLGFILYKLDMSVLLILDAVFVFALLMLFSKPIAQDPKYHDFADKRRCCNVPNFADVISNVPFALVGLLGMIQYPEWYIFYSAIVAVSIGSAYYHWNPNNDTLIWDRLPMSVGFGALYSAVLTSYVPAAAGLYLLFIILSVYGVVHWAATDDLRIYAYVQFYPIVSFALMEYMWPNNPNAPSGIWTTVQFYMAAKVFEHFDRPIYNVCGISGHTMKHLTAAMGLYHGIMM